MDIEPYYEEGGAQVFLGDCLEVMRSMEPESVHAVVTDPPYGLEFMGKEWDKLGKSAVTLDDPADVGGFQDGSGGNAYSRSRVRSDIRRHGGDQRQANLAMQEWHHKWAVEALRVLKPGGHLLAFGGTRTHHRLMCAIEDAGFEIRDCMMWLYGSGFPKSLDVSKAIDKNNGECGRNFRFTEWMRSTGVTAKQLNDATETEMGCHYTTHPTQPAIPTRELFERIRPLIKEVPAWIEQLIDRIEAEREKTGEREVPAGHAFAGPTYGGNSESQTVDETTAATDAAKEWDGYGTALKPAWEPIIVARKPLVGTVAENVQKCGVGALNIDGSRIGTEQVTINTWDEGAQPFGDGAGKPYTGRQSVGRWPANVLLDEEAAALLDGQSGESRDGVAGARTGSVNGYDGGWGALPDHHKGYGGSGGASRFFYTAKASKADRGEWNDHPTVKPTDLMRYLVNLVTKEGQTVLDPFAGSFTTLAVTIALGRNAIAIEKNPDYMPLMEKRLSSGQIELIRQEFINERIETPSLFADPS